MPDFDRAALRQEHDQGGWGTSPMCRGCERSWPCPVIQLLDALERAELDQAVGMGHALTVARRQSEIEYNDLKAKLAASEKLVAELRDKLTEHSL